MITNVDNPFKSPLTAISIGPGIRGIERGVERVARLRTVLNVEIEAFIIENLVAEMEAGMVAPSLIWSDAKTAPWEYFRGIIDILFAGYPCQPFSFAGRRKGTDDPRHLYPYIEKAIDIIRPGMCFFENVRGHISSGLPEVIDSLERLGYSVHWGIFSAEETGASHKRERVFILGIRKELANARRFRQAIRSVVTNRPFECSSVGHAESCDQQHEWEQKGGFEKQIGRSGDEQLANANHQQINKIVGGLWAESDTTSEIMGNPNDTGSEGWVSGKCEECSRERVTRKNGPFFRGVSRPGQPQQAWEHPRVISRAIESAVGLSTNGYHFREDILRALGNSVYANASELAFRTLLTKFL